MSAVPRQASRDPAKRTSKETPHGREPVERASELRSVAQLRMLHSLARRLNQLNNVVQIGEAITAELRTLIDYHNCRVHLINDSGERLIPIAFRGDLTEYQGETFEALVIPMGRGITGRVAVTGEPYYAPDADNDPYAVLIPGTPEVAESILVVPLRYGDRVIGTIALAKLGIDQFDDEDMRVLEVMASHAAVAIENARLFERERQAARTSRELLNLSQALTKVHDVQAVIAEAVASVPTLVQCSDVHAYLRVPETGSFHMVMAGGKADSEQQPVPDVPAHIAERFLLSVDVPFILSKDVVAQVPSEFRRRVVPSDVLVAPFHWDPNGLGAIVLGTASEAAVFSDADLDIARGIADITSLALGNATRMQDLEETAQRLLSLDEMKNTFLDAVSHELRTPLAAVLGIALTLQRQDAAVSVEDSQDLVDRLASNARKLERLLSDLLDLDRLVRGIVEPKRQTIDVGALARRVVEHSDVLPTRPVIFDLHPVMASVDPAKVERIVENLVANTARHTEAGTTVWVRVEEESDGVLIAVEDNGSGVPEGLREAIFEPFRQGPQRSRHSPGVGIGLSLVSKFAELHGGRAWVQERSGGGASFRVWLPIRTVDRATPARVPAD